VPHFKCLACKTRLYRPASGADPGDLCPGCGSLLEPVGELAEIVGFRAIKSRDRADDGGVPGNHERIAGHVAGLIARRESQARLDAERWLDDGGSVSPEAVAEALALPMPKESP
jgi:hypothetical protein